MTVRKTCILILLFLVGIAPVSAADSRPNFLFIFADDWGRFASAYAQLDGPGTPNDAVRTPHFDRLAREGLLFRNAFVSSPSCTPCRSALLSGQHFWRTGRGAILRGAVWDNSIPAFPLLLRQSGYHIGKSYKVWSPGVPGDAPYGEQRYAYQNHGGRFGQFSEYVTEQHAAGKPIERAKQDLYDEVTGNFDDFLKARPAEAPFCYWFGPTNVHRKWASGSGKALWNIDPDALRGKLPPFLADVPEVRQDFADYLGEVQALDAAVGLLLNRLEETGELENTVIIMSGDHGPPGFPHGKCNLYDFGTRVSLAVRWGKAPGGRIIDDLVGIPDLAPTFLELAGLPIPDSMTARSLADILKSDRQGLVDPQRSAVFTGRERHVDRARADYAPYPQRAIRTHDHLYIINFKPERRPLGDPYDLDGSHPPSLEEIAETTFVTYPDDDAGPAKAWLISQRTNPDWKWLYEHTYAPRPREELYDLKQDPHQMRNVAADPAYAGARADLERRLFEELRSTGDPRLIDDGRYFETPPLAGPAEPNPRRTRNRKDQP